MTYREAYEKIKECINEYYFEDEDFKKADEKVTQLIAKFESLISKGIKGLTEPMLEELHTERECFKKACEIVSHLATCTDYFIENKEICKQTHVYADGETWETMIRSIFDSSRKM